MVNILVIIQMESHYLKVCLKMVSNTESGPNFVRWFSVLEFKIHKW